jgi:hypothetical protein
MSSKVHRQWHAHKSAGGGFSWPPDETIGGGCGETLLGSNLFTLDLYRLMLPIVHVINNIFFDDDDELYSIAGFMYIFPMLHSFGRPNLIDPLSTRPSLRGLIIFV